jgi:hypothetical protein
LTFIESIDLEKTMEKKEGKYDIIYRQQMKTRGEKGKKKRGLHL